MCWKMKSIFKLCFVLLLHSFLISEIDCDKTFYELIKMTTSDKIREEGYPAEEHIVTTQDGYVLTMHRIPGKPGAPAVLMMHGLISNSFDFVVMGKNLSLGFILADHGYDVWLGNARGNTYSRRHVSLDPSNPKFWDFSFHEMGIYDLPALITYITGLKNDTIYYIGHSMGTTMSFIMATERPDIAAKVKIMFSLAPSAFLSHSRTPFRLLPPYFVEDLAKRLELYELLPQNFVTRTILKYYCYSAKEDNVCGHLMLLTSGANYAQFNFSIVPLILSHDPAGSSTKAALHYLQIAVAGKFQKYDYRLAGNKIKYNSTEPPEYDFSIAKVPIGLFWAANDLIIHPKDVQILYNLIPNKAFSYKVPDPLFSHADFIFAINVPTVVAPKLLSAMQDYK